jgi:hypothetical protein
VPSCLQGEGPTIDKLIHLCLAAEDGRICERSERAFVGLARGLMLSSATSATADVTALRDGPGCSYDPTIGEADSDFHELGHALCAEGGERRTHACAMQVQDGGPARCGESTTSC